MLVELLLPMARERLATISDAAPLIEAARLLRKGLDIVAVCDREGRLAGIISKTDVVNQISTCQGASCMTGARMVMTRDVTACRPDDPLVDVWMKMTERRLKNVPVVDEERRPPGVLGARDVLEELLKEVEDEEALLRDYVTGIGYR